MFKKSGLICYAMAEVHGKWGCYGCSAQASDIFSWVESNCAIFWSLTPIAVAYLGTLLLSSRREQLLYVILIPYAKWK